LSNPTVQNNIIDLTCLQQLSDHLTSLQTDDEHLAPKWLKIQSQSMHNIHGMSPVPKHSAGCKITAGHWPISDHFSKMANQIFSMVHSLCSYVHVANQIHEELEKWLTISNFLFYTLTNSVLCML